MLTAIVTPEAQRRLVQEHPEPMEAAATTPVARQLPMLPVVDRRLASLHTSLREALLDSQQQQHGIIPMPMAILTMHRITTTPRSTMIPRTTRTIIP